MDKEYLLQRINYESYYSRHLTGLIIKAGESLALCDFHDDKHPSFRVNLKKGVWTCPVCNKGGDVFRYHQDRYGVDFKTSIKEIAEEQGIYMEKPKLVSSYDYTDADGTFLYTKQRYEPGINGGKKSFMFKSAAGNKRGCSDVMYNLPRVSRATWVILVEGEKCADKLIGWGLPATTLDSGADSKLHQEHIDFLDDRKTVVLPDNDAAGQKYAERVASKLKEVKILNLPDLPKKGDIIDWGGTKEQLMELIKKMPILRPERPYVTLQSILPSVVDNMLYADISSLGEMTGLKDIDEKIGCFRRRNLIVVAGRPSMGKSAFMTSVMLNIARRGEPVMLFTPEMSKEESAERLICQINDVNMQNVMLRINHDCNIARVKEAERKLEGAVILLDDTGGIQLEWLEERLIQAIAEYGIKCVFIDYLQLMNTLTKDPGREASYIGYISRNLKRIAKANNIPVVLLAQVNRKCEDRPNKRPMNSDLKGSGDIEQDADVIMFIYRDEVYDEHSEFSGTAEILISKARNGKTGMSRLAFIPESMRFTDLSHNYYD